MKFNFLTAFFFVFCFFSFESLSQTSPCTEMYPNDKLNSGCCFKGFADARKDHNGSQVPVLTSSLIGNCSEVISDKKEKARELYYDDCYCYRNKGTLSAPGRINLCGKLYRILKGNQGTPTDDRDKYSYNCNRLSSHSQCGDGDNFFNKKILKLLEIEGFYVCDNGYTGKDYCNDIITGFLSSDKCSPSQNWEVCKGYIEDQLKKEECDPQTFDVTQCTGGQASPFCLGTDHGPVPVSEEEPRESSRCSPGDSSCGGGDDTSVNQNVAPNGEEPESPIDPISSIPPIRPLPRPKPKPKPTPKPVSRPPFSFGGGFNPSNPSSVSNNFSGSMGSQVRGVRMGVPKAGVSQAGDIGTSGGATSTGTPLWDPPGGPFVSDKNEQSNEPGGAGPSGGVPVGLGGASGASGASSGGGSSNNRRRRGSGGRSSSSGKKTKYMGVPRNSSGSGYRNSSSSIDRRVKDKIKENREKGLSREALNSLLQRRLRGGGMPGRRPDPRTLTPIFYFPDIERAYEDLSKQSQFLDAQGKTP